MNLDMPRRGTPWSTRLAGRRALSNGSSVSDLHPNALSIRRIREDTVPIPATRARLGRVVLGVPSDVPRRAISASSRWRDNVRRTNRGSDHGRRQVC